MPQEERAQIDAVSRRLAEKYAEFPHDHVAGVVERVYARFNQGKLRDFIPLLVERLAGEQLAGAPLGREAVADADGAAPDSAIKNARQPATRNAASRRAPFRWRRLALGVSRG